MPQPFGEFYLRKRALLSALVIVMLTAVSQAAEHPLDPLSKQEITDTIDVLRAAGKITQASRFPIISLHEPAKDEVLHFQPRTAFRREGFVVVYEHATSKTFEAIVDLNKKTLVTWKEVPGVQPMYMNEEIDIADKTVHADPRWVEAMRKRGISDLENVIIDPWSAGDYGLASDQGRRLFRAVFFYRGKGLNYYARPIEGVVAYVDVDARQIVKLVDSGVRPIAPVADLDPKSIGKPLPAPKPLQVTQPEGATFVVNGNQVRWQNWSFRFGMNVREGLVLYTAGYQDGERLRPVLYRGSLSEMVVPYADPGPDWFFRNVFDEGEYGLGVNADSYDPGNDAPPNARFFDAVLPNEFGKSVDLPRAIVLYERDGGILWKHFDFESKHNESRRARELVLGSISTVGNYEYGFNWVFHQDGTLEMEVELTGIVEPRGVTATGERDYHDLHDLLVAPNIALVHHQHFFSFRLDLDVDGAGGNSVMEMNATAMPQGEQNPYGREFVMQETMLSREKDAQRQVDMASHRMWKVINPSVHNQLGAPVGYTLMPGENAVPLNTEDSWVRKRAGFISNHLWVTPYHPDEMFAAGDYPNLSKGGDGLPMWTSANRSIDNQDVVLWYTMGITHIPRPEEWPVMNVHRLGFKLVPSGFFNRNPALAVPPEGAK